MIRTMQLAVVKKDMRAIAFNKRLLPALLAVPLVFTVVLPTIFFLILHFVPDSLDDFDMLLAMLPSTGDATAMMVELLMNRIMPVFFMLIPIMVASVMAASSFVGEKEKRTLETLLYSPLSLKQLFQAKVFASFGMSMLVSLASFLIMLVVTEVEAIAITGAVYLPSVNWLITLLLLSPALSIVAVTLIVRGSAKAQTIEESQQRALFMIMPLLLLIIGQFMGVVLVSAWLLLAIGAVCALLAAVLLQRSVRGFTYETLLN